ncbi:hypothetical protein Poly24_48350 [Rosistilla carotiformis]|uniref:Uncharacterized protein n=1 Tax=Rosistilla carotiformis TaxID=2528017 RepID=A0A518JZY8_9BACT|nr:hypothetical protein [Rosistilla carotiformis]QDV71102.1 hypothetical protein Poly24_48350 [Rosistilla carotiformis]
MTPKRPLRYESLEGRRLLAGDLISTPVFATDSIDVEHRTHPLIAAEAVESSAILVPRDASIDGLIHEADGRVVVVDSSHRSGFASQLWIFDRDANGSLGPARDVVDPGFHVDRMLISGNQAILFGTQWSWNQGVGASHASPDDQPQTLVATIDLPTADAAAGPAIHQTVPGILKELHHNEQQLILVTQTFASASEMASSLPAHETVYTFAITAMGLAAVALQQIEPGNLRVRGNRLFNLTTRTDSPRAVLGPDASPHNAVTQFAIDSQSIDPVAQIEIGSGWIGSFEITSDQTATVIRSKQTGGAAIITAVDILDLSGDTVRLFDSLSVANFAGYVIAAQPDVVLLYDPAMPDGLVVVDTQPQQLKADDRVRRIKIDSNLTLHPEGVRLSNDRVVILATRPQHADPIDRLRDLSLDGRQPAQAMLLTISLQQASLVAISPLGNVHQRPIHPMLRLIDKATRRIGLLIDHQDAADAQSAGFLYGQIDEEGKFAVEGIVPDLQTQDEIDVDASRLLARSDGRLIQHRWDQPDQPTRLVPLATSKGADGERDQ